MAWRGNGRLGFSGFTSNPPGLLDWLACEFIDSGWDIKHMIQLMVGSSTTSKLQASDQLQLEDPWNSGLLGNRAIDWMPR